MNPVLTSRKILFRPLEGDNLPQVENRWSTTDTDRETHVALAMVMQTQRVPS
jgi:hypothetical protein